MKDKKRTWAAFSFYDRFGLERRLARMAERGWILEKTGPFLWTYRRSEPKKLTFCVCWFPKASAFDPGPSEEQQTFYDFCEHTGWVLAGASGQMQVFYNEAPDPVPIETDPVTEVDAIHRAAKRTTLPSQLVLLAVALLNGGLFVARLLQDPVGVLSSTANLFTGVCWASLILQAAAELGGYFLWHHRAVKAAEQGEFLKAKGRYRRFQIICLAVAGLGMLYYVVSILTSGNQIMLVTALLMFGMYMPGLYLVTQCVMSFLKKKNAPARVNLTVTLLSGFAAAFVLIGAITRGVLFGSSRGSVFTASQDELPLTVEELLDVDGSDYTRKLTNQQTFLLAQYEAVQRPRFDAAGYREMPTLEYSVTRVKLPALYSLCKNALLADWEDDWRPEGQRDYTLSIDPAPWGADDAYQLVSQEYGPWNTFLLCYEDRIVKIDFSYGWDITPEQMSLVSEKIGSAAPAPL